MSDVAICHYRLSRAEYDRAIEAGVFEPAARLELVNGDLHAMTPQGSRHATGVELVADTLRRTFGAGFHVRMQLPLAADDYSEPEPDAAVVTGTILDYRDAHPTSAALIVEVSDDSLHHDRTVKQRLYARCGIPEYWILALPDARLEGYRTEHIEFNDDFDANFTMYLETLWEQANHYEEMADYLERNPILALDYLKRAFLISDDDRLRAKAQVVKDEAGLDERARNSVELLAASF